MVNYQVADYVENNELICFGLSQHDVEEWLPKWTPKAIQEISIVKSWVKKDNIDNVLVRPGTRSDWDYTAYGTRSWFRLLLGFAAIRELPIKSFYARATISYIYFIFFLCRGIGRGHNKRRPAFMYNTHFQARALANYPDLLWWNLTKVIPRNPPVPDTHREWRTRQNPVFHQYHKTVYRYRMRRPRFVAWDGSQNQPVMPYLHDSGTDVINGTFTRLCNSTPTRK